MKTYDSKTEIHVRAGFAFEQCEAISQNDVLFGGFPRPSLLKDGIPK